MSNGKEYTFNNLSDYIVNSGKIVTVNNMQSRIKDKDIEAFKKIVWIIYKIRDSIAHIQTIKFQDNTSITNLPQEDAVILYDNLGIKFNNSIPYDNSFFIVKYHI